MQRQLEDGVCDLEELRRLKTDQESAPEQAKAELEQGLASRETQLRQAQEELEHYFLEARAGDQLAQAQLEQFQRAQRLMARLKQRRAAHRPLPPGARGGAVARAGCCGTRPQRANPGVAQHLCG